MKYFTDMHANYQLRNSCGRNNQLIIQANDKLVIMSEIVIQTRAKVCVTAAACTLRREENCALA